MKSRQDLWMCPFKGLVWKIKSFQYLGIRLARHLTYLARKSGFKVVLFTDSLVWGCWFSRPLLSKMILLQFNFFFFPLEQTFQFLVNFWKKLILKIPPVFSLLLWSSRLLNSAILEVLLTNVVRILVWICLYVTYYYYYLRNFMMSFELTGVNLW